MKTLAFPNPLDRLERSHLDDINRWVDQVVRDDGPTALLILGCLACDTDVLDYPGLKIIQKVGETRDGIRAYEIKIDILLGLMSVLGFSEKDIDEQSKDHEPGIVHVLFIASGQCILTGYRQVDPDGPGDGGEPIPELETKVA